MHNASDDNTPAATELSPTYKALKGLAIVMGVVLVGGLIFVFASMGKQIASTGKTCDPTSILLSPEDELVRVDEKNNRLAVWLKGADGAVIIRHYDICNGRILHDVRISGGRPPAATQGQTMPPSR